MKLPDCAFNIDVKSAFTFWDPIILSGVTACQRGAEIKKTPCISMLYRLWFGVWIRSLKALPAIMDSAHDLQQVLKVCDKYIYVV